MDAHEMGEEGPGWTGPTPPTLAEVLALVSEEQGDEADTTTGDLSDDLPSDNEEEEEREQRGGPNLRKRVRRSFTKGGKRKLWEEPLPADCVEKSSTYVHICPLCGSVRTGTSSLWQHLASVHQKRMVDVGRWVHCSTCGANFNHDATWRTHLPKTNCPQASMSIRWREKKREEGGSEEEVDETSLIGLDGRSKPMKDLKKRRRGNEEEDGKERKKPYLRPYMKPRAGWLIVHQTTNFRCAVCGESDLPTLPSLVYHQRKEHSVQLSQVEHWLRCFGCGQDAASLSWIRDHLKEAAAAAFAAGEPAPCSWKTAALVWHAEETSEEAKRFRDGLDPVPPSSSTSSSARPETSSESPGVRIETIDEDGGEGGSTIPFSSLTKKRKHQQRADKSYILPRPGHVIVRRQANMVCQLCGEGGFATCSSIDHHMRKVHRAGVHQAGMWMHCGRCGQDFCNISSVRTHVSAAEGGDGGSCGWPNIFMCWHEKEGENGVNGATEEEGGTSAGYQGNLAARLNEFAAAPKRHRKLFKPPSQAEDGYVIVKRTVDLPCFGCPSRCASLTTFIWCMQGKHRLYFSDVGAWMECACGRPFTSTTALRGHLREDGGEGEGDCSMPRVALCWQQKIGGRETQTPSYAGFEAAPVDGRADETDFLAELLASSSSHQAPQFGEWTPGEEGGAEEEMRDGDIYDPAVGWIDPMASGVVKEEIVEVKEEPVDEDEDQELMIEESSRDPPPSDLPQPSPLIPESSAILQNFTETQRYSPVAAPASGSQSGARSALSEVIAVLKSGAPASDELFASAMAERQVAQSRVRAAHQVGKSAPRAMFAAAMREGVVKDEEVMEMRNGGWEGEEEEEAERVEMEEEEVEDEVNDEGGRRLATFDPTGYADGARFVLRKTEEMGCRSCGEISASPGDLAVHLWSAHEEEMRGARRDWHDQQWLECAGCRSLFHAAADHEEHLYGSRPCSMADARLCWMEKEE